MGCGNALTNTIIPTDMINPDHMKKSQIIEKNESFNKIRRIGKGSYGEVFLIKSNKTQKEYALKAIKIKGVNQNILERIMIEVDNLKSLDHPNIISFKCAFESNIKVPLLNIITEYADNGDLEEKLKLHNNQKKYFEENELLDWIIQNCLALQYLHGKDIIHRDIKPSNIFIKNQQLKIGDFGLATRCTNTDKLLKSKKIEGTPLYLTPEQMNFKPYNEKVDIYACGIILYEMCSCFSTSMERYEYIMNLKNNNIISEKVSKNYPEESLLIKSMIKKDYNERPSAKEILKSDLFVNLGKSLGF